MIALAFLLFACAPKTVGLPLPGDAALRLQTAGEHPESLGELVYDGRVQQRGDEDAAIFRYERWVQRSDTGWTASHLTYDVDETPIVLHVARYTDDYELLSFEELHGQKGVVGLATVSSTGELAFRVTRGDQTKTRSEDAGDPVHAGPTLFGHVLEHWDALIAGETRTLRFVVMDAARTYRFAIRLESSDAATTVFRMAATSAFVRLAVPSMRITFATPTRDLIRYEGLVPPMTGPPDALRVLDARVDYTRVPER